MFALYRETFVNQAEVCLALTCRGFGFNNADFRSRHVGDVRGEVEEAWGQAVVDDAVQILESSHDEWDVSAIERAQSLLALVISRGGEIATTKEALVAYVDTIAFVVVASVSAEKFDRTSFWIKHLGTDGAVYRDTDSTPATEWISDVCADAASIIAQLEAS